MEIAITELDSTDVDRMKIVHRVGLHVDPESQRRLAALGIEAGFGFAAFDVDESDPNWAELARLMAEWQASDVIRTETTRDEQAAAARLVMRPAWHHGYPLPDNDRGYLGLTFDLAHYCAECGIGAVQKAPFRMRGEPKWGKRGILQLNWVFDEYFVRPDAWREVFKPFGISFRPVLKYKTDIPLETVVQLAIDTIADTPLRIGDHPFRSRQLPTQEILTVRPWVFSSIRISGSCATAAHTQDPGILRRRRPRVSSGHRESGDICRDHESRHQRDLVSSHVRLLTSRHEKTN